MRAGDFFLEADGGLEAWAIREATRGPWSHTGLIVSDDGATVEALAGGVAAGSVAAHSGRVVVVDSGLTDAERAVAVAFAAGCIGAKYDDLDIASFGINLVTGGKLVLGEAGHWICSALVFRCLQQANPQRFPEDPRTISPNDLGRRYGQE